MHETADCRFTPIVLAGPGPMELSRIGDLMAALFHYEPNCHRLVLVDDAPEPRDLASLLPAPPPTCKLEIIRNPRDRTSQRITMAISPGVLAGLKQACRGEVGRFVIKLDSDALIIGPFSARIGSVLDRQPDAGLLGACHYSPAGEKRGNEHHVRVFGNCARWLVAEADRQHCGRRRRFPTRRREFAMLRTVRKAIRGGYTLGDSVQGGGYAISAEALRRIDAAHLLENANLWVDTFASEDSITPMYVEMVGMKLVDYVGENEVFGVVYRGLPAPPEECARRNYGIIHCIKNDKQFTEQQIRDYFSARRADGR